MLLVLFYIRCVCCYLVFDSCNVSIIGLYMSIYASFMCNLFLLSLYIRYFSDLFRCFPFLSVFMMFSMGYTPMCVSVRSMWFEYPELPLLSELPLLLLINCICSLYGEPG
jgi:hypothetical protein